MGTRFNSRYAKFTVISYYARIEGAEKEDKDAFYDQLQEAIHGVPAHDMRP